MPIDVITKLLTSEKEIPSQSLYKLAREVNIIVSDHHRTCNPGKIDLIDNTIFCKSCGKILLKFCRSCGSTRIGIKEYVNICYNCGEVYENYF